MAEPISIQQLKDASLDVKSLEEVVNGNEDVVVTTRLGETYPSVKGSIKKVFEYGGLPAEPFETLANMEADGDSLADGQLAIVYNEAANNGLYVKTAGTWVKSAYDPANTALESTLAVLDEKSGFLEYEPQAVLIDDLNSGVLKTSLSSVTLLVKVEPNTTYTVEKEPSSRFVINGYSEKPITNSTLPSQLIKSRESGAFTHIDSYGKYLDAASFTTGASVQYVAIYIKSNYETKTPATQIKQGGVFDFTDNYLTPIKSIAYGGKSLDNSAQTTVGKNLFDGKYENWVLRSVLGDPKVEFRLSDDAYTAIVPVKPNTTYTVSKTVSNRFKVALTKAYPQTEYVNEGRTLLGDNQRDLLEFTFTTNADEYYAVIFVAFTGGTPPKFMQVEEGALKTSWQTYGKKIVSNVKPVDSDGNIIDTPVDDTGISPLTGYLAYLDIGVGDANHTIRGVDEAYTDSTATVIATDDTDALQAAFDRGGVIHLNGTKSYKVTRPLTIDLKKVKLIEGNGATLISTHDGVTLQVIGEQTTTAKPSFTTSDSMKSVNRHVRGIRLTSASGIKGQAATISNTFMLEFDVEVYWMRDGIEYININRNIHLRPKLYMIQEDAIRFDKTCNIHQGQIYVGDVSYCKRNIYFDDPAEIYNLQFLGGDYEIGTSADTIGGNLTPDCLIHLKQVNGILADITFSGMTLEDHNASNVLIKIESSNGTRCKDIRFTDNFYANAEVNVFEVGNVNGLVITGRTADVKGTFLKITGRMRNLHVDVSGTSISKLLHSVGDFNLEQAHFKFVTTNLIGNPVVLDCNIDMLHITDCILQARFTEDYDASKGLVDVVATGRSIKQLRISDNSIFTPLANIDIVKITGTPSGRIRVQGNESNAGGLYPANGGNVISTDNY